MAETYYERMTEVVMAMTGATKPLQSFPRGRGSLWTHGHGGDGAAHWHLYIPINFVDGRGTIKHAAGHCGVFANLNGKTWLILKDGRAWAMGTRNIHDWCEVLNESDLEKFVKAFENHAAQYVLERFHSTDINEVVAAFLQKKMGFKELREAIS